MKVVYDIYDKIGLFILFVLFVYFHIPHSPHSNLYFKASFRGFYIHNTHTYICKHTYINIHTCILYIHAYISLDYLGGVILVILT